MKNPKLKTTSGAALGAEIHNINLKDHLSDKAKKTPRKALDDHEVIFFPNQNLIPTSKRGHPYFRAVTAVILFRSSGR